MWFYLLGKVGAATQQRGSAPKQMSDSKTAQEDAAFQVPGTVSLLPLLVSNTAHSMRRLLQCDLRLPSAVRLPGPGPAGAGSNIPDPWAHLPAFSVRMGKMFPAGWIHPRFYISELLQCGSCGSFHNFCFVSCIIAAIISLIHNFKKPQQTATLQK